MILFYTPPDRDNIALSLAEAICITHGGKPSPDLETPENKQLLKQIKTDDIRLQMGGFGEPQKYLLGSEAQEMAQRGSLVHIVVNIGEVHILINEKTTLKQALDRFNHKLKWLNKHHPPRNPTNDEHQRG